MFRKSVSIAGGLLVLAAKGAGALCLERRLATFRQLANS